MCCIFVSNSTIVIIRVIKEKNYFLIPIYTAWISLIASSCWTTYGIYLYDFNVMFPNCVGVILAIVQILVYLNYKRKYPTIGEKDFTSTIGIENTYNDEGKKDEITIKSDEDVQNNSKDKPVKIVEKVDN